MAERTLLLGLMRRLRRRRRWVDSVTGGAIAVAVIGPAVAAAIPLLRGRGSEPGAAALVAILLGAAVVGGIAAGLRRVPLSDCARAVDRALGPRQAGDRVFAAVSFAENESASSFIAALTADAWTRASTVSPRQIVPPPPRHPFVLAVVGVAAVLVLSLGPRFPSLASTGPRLANVVDRLTTDAVRATDAAALIRLSAASVESEREDAKTAAVAARTTADEELGRLAREFALLVGELSETGAGAAAAVNRAQRIAAEARDAAAQARAAWAAAQAGKAALSSSGGGRAQRAAAGALANTLDARPAAAAADAEPAATAAVQLAAGGAAGRETLARAAAAAAEALARGAGSGSRGGDAPAAGDPDADPGDGDAESPRRRLNDGSEQAGKGPGATGRRPAGAQQRRLQQLRRDLQRSAADCRRDPDACRRGAANTGRSLDDLSRQGQSAKARARLAESAQQLLDRLQRGGAGVSADDARRMRSFSRSARGSGPGRGGPRSGVPSGSGAARGRPAMIARAAGDDHPGGGDGRDESDPLAGESALAVESGDDGTGAPEQPGGGEGEGEGEGDDTGQTGAAGASRRGNSGAALGGAGAGEAPGGAVLGARTPGGGSVGRDAPTAVAGSGAGPSRSQVIGGAAARGFASAEYRRVFTDYAGVIEESLDNTAVPPGRRYLVRRYFQLIRPRGP